MMPTETGHDYQFALAFVVPRPARTASFALFRAERPAAYPLRPYPTIPHSISIRQFFISHIRHRFEDRVCLVSGAVQPITFPSNS